MKQDEDYFLVVDSRSETISINCDNIDQFAEVQDNGKLMLVYFIPDEKADNKLKKETDQFECGENELVLKTFKAIRHREQAAGKLHGFIT